MYDLIRNRDSRVGQHKAIEKSIVTYVGMSGSEHRHKVEEEINGHRIQRLSIIKKQRLD